MKIGSAHKLQDHYKNVFNLEANTQAKILHKENSVNHPSCIVTISEESKKLLEKHCENISK